MRFPNLPGHPRWQAVAEVLLWSVLLVQVLRLAWPLLDAPASIMHAHVPPPTDSPALAGHDPFLIDAQPAASGDANGWRVFGIRLSSDGNAAILGTGEGPQQAFRVGDEIETGVMLDIIAADHVMLRQAGQPRRLELPGEMLQPTTTPATAATTTPASAAAETPAQASSTRADVDPGRLIAEAGMRMAMEAGRLTGYTLLPRGNDTLLRAAGLQPGDVLVSVNGQALDPERLAELADQLKSNPRAEIAYRRDGQLRTVTLGSGKP